MSDKSAPTTGCEKQNAALLHEQLNAWQDQREALLRYASALVNHTQRIEVPALDVAHAIRKALNECSCCGRGEPAGAIRIIFEDESAYDLAIQEAKAEGWDEAAAIDAGCHDYIALNGETNPYRADDEVAA